LGKVASPLILLLRFFVVPYIGEPVVR